MKVIGWDWVKRGDICVIRSVHGRVEVVRLDRLRDYREWSGCFSII